MHLGWEIHDVMQATRAQEGQAGLTFVFSQTHALIAVNEVPAGGGVQARGREALVIFFLTVEAVVTWRAEKKACGQRVPFKPTLDQPARKAARSAMVAGHGQRGFRELGPLGDSCNVAFREGWEESVLISLCRIPSIKGVIPFIHQMVSLLHHVQRH